MKSSVKLLSLCTLVCALLLGTVTSSFAQATLNGKSCVGVWKTIDDETGKEKSHVQVFEKGGKYYGKIIKLLDESALEEAQVSSFEELTCSECSGDKKDQPILGMEIIWDMEKKSDKYGGGTILDPKKGSEYTCTMWMDDEDATGNTLKVRGWWGFIYRTQTWYRVK